MARTTRLTNEDRAAIAKAMLQHKFGAEADALRTEENVLADVAYLRAYGKWTAAMAKLPEGALPTDASISVNATGRFNLRYKGGEYYHYGAGLTAYETPLDPEKRRQFTETAYDVAMPDDDGERVRAWAMRVKEVYDEAQKVKASLEGALAKFNSFEALLEKWPEAEKFVLARQKERGLYVAPSLPATLLFDLNKMLDLPPEGEDDASEVDAEAA